MKPRSRWLPLSRNAIMAAVYFVTFEGTFWMGGIYFWKGEMIAILPLGIAALAFAFFVTYAGKEVRDER